MAVDEQRPSAPVLAHRQDSPMTPPACGVGRLAPSTQGPKATTSDCSSCSSASRKDHGRLSSSPLEFRVWGCSLLVRVVSRINWLLLATSLVDGHRKTTLPLARSARMSGASSWPKPPTQDAAQSCPPRCSLPGRFLGALWVGKKGVEGVHRTAPAFFLPLSAPANSQFGKGLVDSVPPPSRSLAV